MSTEGKHSSTVSLLVTLTRFFRKHDLFILAFLAILHGGIYTFIVPPWQHYDEPSHFERAWRIAHSRDNAESPENLAIRQSIAGSMVETRFFDDLDIQPDLFAEDAEIWIGIPQSQDPPLYYWLASLPLRIFQYGEITTQLYAVRLLSVLLYVLVVLISGMLAREIFGPSSRLRWVLPLLILITPAFTDLMSAINNDVAAVFFFSIFLYLGVRLILRGFSSPRALLVLFAIVPCLFTKSTIWLAAPLGILAVLISLHLAGFRYLRTLWITMALLGAGLFIWLLDTSEPAAWYGTANSSNERSSIRQTDAQTAVGTHVLVFDPASPRRALFQPVPGEVLSTLRGQWITIGAWMWADSPMDVQPPYIWADRLIARTVSGIGQEPQFVSFQTKVPTGADTVYLVLQPQPNTEAEASQVYVDGIVMLPGRWPDESSPTFLDREASQGEWDGQAFNNLVRNASAERTWLTIRADLNTRFLQAGPVNLNRFLMTSQDPANFSWLYLSTAKNTFQSFWARFGWNQVRLEAGWYWALVIIVLTGLIGFFARAVPQRRDQPIESRLATSWLVLSGGVIWLQVFTRPIAPFWGNPLFIPGARYAYPAIIPSMLVLAGGWLVAAQKLRMKRPGLIGLLGFILVLDLVSILTIMEFYA